MAEIQLTDHDALFSELVMEIEAKTRELDDLKRVPEGPWAVLKVTKDEMRRNSIIHYGYKAWNLTYPTSTFFGPRKLCVVVCDALNRNHQAVRDRLKGDETE